MAIWVSPVQWVAPHFSTFNFLHFGIGQAPGMVAVVMPNDDLVHLFQVDAQDPDIVYQDLGLRSCVKQDGLFRQPSGMSASFGPS